jgi:hypothetical protein
LPAKPAVKMDLTNSQFDKVGYYKIKIMLHSAECRSTERRNANISLSYKKLFHLIRLQHFIF